LIADQADGSKCQSDSCIADPVARLLAGSYFYDSGKDLPRITVTSSNFQLQPICVEEQCS
jgi:hypothetical protein